MKAILKTAVLKITDVIFLEKSRIILNFFFETVILKLKRFISFIETERCGLLIET